MNKKIILISGKKGSGKTTASQEIIKVAGDSLDIQIFSFAKPLKETSNALIESTFGKEYTNNIWKELVRPIYQAVGVVGRSIDKRYWVNKTLSNIMDSNCDVAIIDDVRFPNEFDITKDIEGYDVLKIRITRPSDIDDEDEDESETSMDKVTDDKFDMVVYNMTMNPNTLNELSIFLNKGTK